MAAYDVPQRWNGGIGEVTPYGLFADLACARSAVPRPQHLLARRPWRCAGAGPPPSEAAVEAMRVPRALLQGRPNVGAQMRAYGKSLHPHVPAALLKSFLQEDADADARRAQYDPYAGSRLAVCDDVRTAYASLGGSANVLSACALEDDGDGATAWRTEAVLDSAIEQLAFGSGRVHAAPILLARTLFSVHVLRTMATDGRARGGATRLRPVYSVRCPTRPIDVVPSPYACGELAVCLDDGAVLTLALHTGGRTPGDARAAEAPLPVPTACTSLRGSASGGALPDAHERWHAIRYGNHPRTLWSADSCALWRVDVRSPPLGSCRVVAHAHGDGGARAHDSCLSLDLAPSDRIHALSLAPDGGSAGGASSPLVALASRVSLVLLDERFLRCPVLTWRPPDLLSMPELHAPPFVHFAPEPRAVLRCDRESAHALCYAAATRASCVPAAAPLPRSVLLFPSGANGAAGRGPRFGEGESRGCADCADWGTWRQIETPVRGSVLRVHGTTGAARAFTHSLLALDSGGCVWALELSAHGAEDDVDAEAGAPLAGRGPGASSPDRGRARAATAAAARQECGIAAGALTQARAFASAHPLRCFTSSVQMTGVRALLLPGAGGECAAASHESGDGLSLIHI